MIKDPMSILFRMIAGILPLVPMGLYLFKPQVHLLGLSVVFTAVTAILLVLSTDDKPFKQL